MRVCITLLLALWASALSSASLFNDEWDGEFQDATEAFLPVGTDHLLLKAQCYQESRLNPFAVSPVGAFGLCQFMPGTAGDVARVLNVTQDQFWLPEVSIRAAGYYMGRMIRIWTAPRPSSDRYKLALASYNAGAGRLIKAQRLCCGRNLYPQIIECLPLVTGNHSIETIDYTDKIINRWYPRMLAD